MAQTLKNYFILPEKEQATRYLLIGLGLLLVLPSWFSGLFADDYNHAVLVWQLFSGVEHLIQPDNASLANLFTFVTPDEARRQQLMTYGLLPWWTVDGFSMVFYRPFSELTHILDYAVLQSPILMHIHSWLWYALMLVLLARFYQKGSAAALVFISPIIFCMRCDTWVYLGVVI